LKKTSAQRVTLTSQSSAVKGLTIRAYDNKQVHILTFGEISGKKEINTIFQPQYHINNSCKMLKALRGYVRNFNCTSDNMCWAFSSEHSSRSCRAESTPLKIHITLPHCIQLQMHFPQKLSVETLPKIIFTSTALNLRDMWTTVSRISV
jgi:hypothetical protein